MKSYIFITTEGYTYQPNSEAISPDIENCQVIGFSEGRNPQDAFNKLIEDNKYLMETNYEEIFSLELKSNGRSYFNLKKYKSS
jgi:hypothetical protein